MNNLLALLQFGTLPADLTRRNIQNFAEKVMPHLRGSTTGSVAGEMAA
jgi:hypothetical protein